MINREYQDLYNGATCLDIGRHMFFCDGSKDKVGAGAGIVYLHGRPDHSRPEDYVQSLFQFSLGCGKKTTSYDAEMLALAAAALHAYETAMAYYTNDLPFTDLFFFSDSTSALTNITDPGPHPGQIYSISFIRNITFIIDIFPSVRIHLGWSPGHSGVTGNESADYYARKGVTLPSPNHSSQAHLKAKLKSSVRKDMKARVKADPNSRGTAFINYYPPKPKPTNVFKNTSRELFARATQTLTGHGYTGEYYSRMKLENTKPWCLCSSSAGAPVFHTRSHVLKECPRHAPFRHILEDAIPDLHDADWDLASLGEPKTLLPFLIEFMTCSGAFTKLDVPFSLNLILPPERPKKPP